MSTDTTEKGLERLIVKAMTGLAGDGVTPVDAVRKPAVSYGGTGWLLGDPTDYDREHCVDLFQLRAFLRATQPKAAEALALDEDGPTRGKFLARLQGEISKRGARSTCCATGSGIGHTTSTSSTAHHRRATTGRRRSTQPTASA